ncbi:MAG TPA: glycosyltransferase family 2 protein [Stellaceae bacterium]|nr:glycosyltransferase family 2 protein [Stellaceae bacterium]
MIAWIAVALAVFYSLWSVALAALFARHLRILEDRLSARVSLVLPATGTLPGLEDLLTALTVQSLPPHRVIAAVESREDPAYTRIAALARRYPELNIQVVVAGLSPLRSQKCTNLLAALEKLEAEDAYVVLLDADIRPQPWWLAALVGPLAAGRADIVNGYRWPTPTTLSSGTALVAMIDRAIAVLPRLSQTRPIWGGSLAVTRHALEKLDLPNTIGRTLTEDLPIGDRAVVTGLRVLTRRAIRPPTPLGGSFRDLWRFGRRQYQLIRLYRRGLWRFAAFVVTTDLTSRLILLVAMTSLGAAVAALLIVAALGSIATEIRLAISGRLGVADGIGFRLAQHLLVWTILPAPVFHASVIWGGAVTSPVVWRHVRYAVDRTGQVVDVARRPYSDKSV